MATTRAPVSLSLVAAYRSMLTIRRFEERVLDLRSRDEIAGSVHLCTGQEATPTGALAVLSEHDRVVATYRGHGWALACGVPPDELLAEICQRETGVNGGRAGSAYLSAPEHRFVGENSIVGAGLPIACGVALGLRARGDGGVVLAVFGDGATSQGATHEALVMAAARSLPVVFVCENNGWSEMTPISQIALVRDLSARAAGYGIAGASIDGDDPVTVANAVAEASERARRGEGPTLLECRTHRLGAHYHADIEHYRDDEDRARARAADPLARLRARLLTDGASDEAALSAIEEEVDALLAAAEQAALDAPAPDPATAADHVVGRAMPVDAAARLARPAGDEMPYSLAVNAALRRELGDRPEVVVYGEDVGHAGGIFGVTRGLQRDFGPERVFDTPIAESAILGGAVGASMTGLRPVVEIMWGDFLLVALDQLVNQAANVRYLSRGSVTAPLVVRCQQAVTPGSCAQHSQSLEALLAHIPGLRVGLPATPHDAWAMLRAAVADDDPCILFESRALYGARGPVDTEAPIEPVGGARVRRQGDDLTIVSWGRMATLATEAGELLARDGVSAEVIDLRWLCPLDIGAITDSVARTGRLLIAHEATISGGFGAEIAARIAAQNFHDLDAPIARVAPPDVRFPSAPSLQDALLPDAARIAEAARELASH